MFKKKLITMVLAAMCFAACGVQKPLTDAQYEQSVRKDIPFAVSEFRQVKPDVYAFKCDKYVEQLPDYDVSAATENLLLAAHAMGLGAVWTGLHPDMDRAKMVQEMLGLPEHIIPLCVVPVGVPAEQPEIKDKYKPENIHYNGWE